MKYMKSIITPRGNCLKVYREKDEKEMSIAFEHVRPE